MDCLDQPQEVYWSQPMSSAGSAGSSPQGVAAVPGSTGPSPPRKRKLRMKIPSVSWTAPLSSGSPRLNTGPLTTWQAASAAQSGSSQSARPSSSSSAPLSQISSGGGGGGSTAGPPSAVICAAACFYWSAPGGGCICAAACFYWSAPGPATSWHR